MITLVDKLIINPESNTSKDPLDVGVGRKGLKLEDFVSIENGVFSLIMTLQLGHAKNFPYGKFHMLCLLWMISVCHGKWNFCRRKQNAVKELKSILHRQAWVSCWKNERQEPWSFVHVPGPLT